MTVFEGKSYPVYIGSDIIKACIKRLSENGITGKAAVISDCNVFTIYGKALVNTLEQCGYSVCTFTFPAGEASKNIATLTAVLEFLAENDLTRTDCILALGGGVTGDLAGLAAGLYMRGIAWLMLPTTLLADVDSSVGGKTAIDLHAGKNLAGLFYMPKAVICDIKTLDTLPESVFAQGVAEAVKTAIVGDEELFGYFENNSYRENIAEIIGRCVKLKMRITDTDERDVGERRLLNLGHTPAHAIEKLSGYTISHGYAVAAGLSIMCRVSVKLGVMRQEDAQKIIGVLKSCGLPTQCSFSAKELAHAAGNDKKRSADSILIVLPERIGACRVLKTDVDRLEGLFGECTNDG